MAFTPDVRDLLSGGIDQTGGGDLRMSVRRIRFGVVSLDRDSNLSILELLATFRRNVHSETFRKNVANAEWACLEHQFDDRSPVPVRLKREQSHVLIVLQIHRVRRTGVRLNAERFPMLRSEHHQFAIAKR